MDRVLAGVTGCADAKPASGLSNEFAVRPLSLRVNFSWTLIGNVVYAACQWGMLITLAKVGSSEMVGQFALGLAVVAPIVAFSMLSLRAVQATDARREYSFADYFGLRLLCSALAMAAIIAVAPFVAGSRETAWVILCVGLAAIPESISDVLYGLLQQRERMNRIAVSMMLKGPLMLAAMFGIMLLTHNVCLALLAVGISRLVVLVFYDIPSGVWVLGASRSAADRNSRSRERIAPRWDRAVMGQLAWLAFPLGTTVMLSALIGSIPRYFIEHELGTRELGIFAAIAYLMLVGTTLVRALGQSASPRLSQYYAAGKISAFCRLLFKLMLIGAVLGLAAVAISIVAGRELLAFFYSPEYAEENSILVWIMAAAGVQYIASFLGYGMTAARYFRVQVLMNCITLGTMFTACWLLISGDGLQGAAIAVLVTNCVLLVAAFLIVFHAIRNTEIQVKHPVSLMGAK